MTIKQRFFLVEEIIHGDQAMESDYVHMDIHGGKKVSKREQALAETISNIYQVVHPSKDCPHPEWDRENIKALKYLQGDNNLLPKGDKE